MTRFAAAICDCTVPLNAMPKMSGIQVNDACGAGDVSVCLVLYSGSAIARRLGQGFQSESGYVGYCYMDRLPRGMGTTGLICICFR
jgi:hypothetical protein